MNLGNKRLKIVEEIKAIMQELGIKMTIRQIYYQLVSKHIIENSIKSYKGYNKIITLAREQRLIYPFSIVDTSKPVLKISSWQGLKDFLETVRKAYKKSIWTNQDKYVEIWLEKDALRGIFKPICDKYDVHLCIGRGYQSYTNLIKASQRLPEDKEIHILYYGDFDPTGLDIPRNIKDRLEEFGVDFEFHRLAITDEQIKQHNISPIPTKKTDSRTAGFVAEHGDRAVELDALNPKVLMKLIEDSITQYLDKNQYEETLQEQEEELSKIGEFIDNCEIEE